MIPHRPQEPIDQQLVSRIIASGIKTLRFPAQLEAHFEAETGAARSHRILLWGFVGIAFSTLYLVIDWTLTPDVFEAALWLRVGLITPLTLVVMAILRQNPPPWLRESMVGAICIAVAAATLTLMLKSESPLRDGHNASSVLVVLFLTVLLRQRFPYAVASCVVIFAFYAYALAAQSGYASERLFTDIWVLGCAMVIALFASYSLEHDVRLSYLFELRERLRYIDVQSLSLRDALTGLDNRRSLEGTLARLDQGGHSGATAVLLIDVDYFKPYNDTLGHLAGDVCLKRIAGLIQSERRGGDDMAFRFGGEEFLVLLPDADLTAAISVADRIRRGIESAAIPHPGRPLPPQVVTVSIGVAAARLGGAITGQELISGADNALYAAKRAGRNQVWPKRRPMGMVTELTKSRRTSVG